MDTGMDKRAVSCVLLAAGAGLRFGGGKLLAEFDGERLFERAMNVLPEELFARVAVVSGCEEILAESERRGAAVLQLEVRESNFAARRLYEKNGFEIVGKRKNYYEKPAEDAILMSKFFQKEAE